MANYLLREQVVKLRLQGFTYGQIRRKLGISKSTLSDWLRNLPLTPQQVSSLTKNRQLSRVLAREKFIETFKRRRLIKLKGVLKQQTEQLLPLTEKELFIAGLFLYWGEGEKHRGRVSVSNTDPKIIKFTKYWMVEILEIPVEKIKVYLHLYKDMDIKEAIQFWSKTLSIPENQFMKPYIKSSNRSDLTYKSHGHGTCRLFCANVFLSEKIAMSLKAISDQYGEKSNLFWYN